MDNVTCATAVVMWVPPAAPKAILTSPVGPTIIVGAAELSGLFPPAMKLAREGGTPKVFTMSGELKSSISLFRIIPVLGDAWSDPNLSLRRRNII